MKVIYSKFASLYSVSVIAFKKQKMLFFSVRKTTFGYGFTYLKSEVAVPDFLGDICPENYWKFTRRSFVLIKLYELAK